MEDVILNKSNSLEKKPTFQRASLFSRDKIVPFALNALMIMFSGFLLYSVVKSIEITNEKVALLETAKDDVDALRIKNLELILREGEIESNNYVEMQARDRLNYGRDGEYLFVIPDDVLKKVDLNKIVEPTYTGTVPKESKTWGSTLDWKKFVLEGI